jgi:release factor glutamine methyltransferase
VAEHTAGATIAGLLASSARALGPSSETARLDAEVLLAHVLGVDRARLVLDHDAELEGEPIGRFEDLISRRRRGEPVAYLIGRRPFRALELTVDARVLIPRPETEGIVEAAVELLPSGATVLDVGTGSGAIALALAAERPDLVVRGIDVSADAVAVAERNRADLDLDVSFTVGDLLDGAPPADAVLANLPYVERDAQLPIDVAGFEPSLALFGGDDGLDVIRRLVSQLTARPWPRWALLEIGESQGAAVTDLMYAAGFPQVDVRADLSGRDRVVVAQREEGEE